MKYFALHSQDLVRVCKTLYRFDLIQTDLDPHTLTLTLHSTAFFWLFFIFYLAFYQFRSDLAQSFATDIGLHVRIPATSYLVPLFTLIYLVLLHLLLPSYLNVLCYLNNRQRYCSVWPERDRTLYTTYTNPLNHSHTHIRSLLSWISPYYTLSTSHIDQELIRPGLCTFRSL